MQTAAIANELTGEKKADTGAGPGAQSKSGNEPVSLANTVAPKPTRKSGRVSANFAKAAEPFTSTATPGDVAYKIGPQDVLEISVFKVPELSKSAQVAEIGTINLPLLGEVPAAGKTARELERDLTAKLGAKYLQSPQVTVAVKEYNAQRVTIEGAIRKPGVYPIRSKTSLLQLTAMAEGLRDDAESSGIVIFRQD
ncbi:MAG: polysaccharide biosynthesis/export family protein, partial [Filomicrobium sp.]